MKNVNVIQQTKINNARSLPCSRFLCDRDFAVFEFVLFSTSCVEKSLIFLFALLLVFVGIRTPFSCSLFFWSVDVHVFVLPFEVPRNINRLD